MYHDIVGGQGFEHTRKPPTTEEVLVLKSKEAVSEILQKECGLEYDTFFDSIRAALGADHLRDAQSRRAAEAKAERSCGR